MTVTLPYNVKAARADGEEAGRTVELSMSHVGPLADYIQTVSQMLADAPNVVNREYLAGYLSQIVARQARYIAGGDL